MPWLLVPGCVNPAAAARASTDNSTDYSQCLLLPSPVCDGASVTSAISDNIGMTANTVQEVVTNMSATQCQYQDCTVGFCGGWDSHDHTVQVSSQSHIHDHPSSMHGTQ